MPPFGAWERVKGKRVQIPHDLVTVIREPAARVHLHRSLGFDPGRRRQALSFQPGNLPIVWYREFSQITSNWSYFCVLISCSVSMFHRAEFLSVVLWKIYNHQQEEL